jgi:diguanylate cyclase
MYDEDPRDVTILKTLLPLMSKHAAGYHPISYSVWYEYAKGERPALRHSIDAELKSQGRLTAALTYSLYSRHLVEPAEQALVTARANLMGLLETVQGAAQTAGADTSGFDARLLDFRRGLAQATSLQDVAGQVEAMVAETRRVSDSFGRFHAELDHSKVEVARLTEELDRLRQDALIDALSGLMNRRGFDRELDRLLAGGAPDGPFSVISFDIDNFKKVNASYGHPLGDAVIASVGRLIRDCLGQVGFAARYGGEEFVVALPAQPIAKAEEVAEAIRLRVENGKIRRRQTDEPIAGITISAGVASWRAGDKVDTLLERADRALYASKEMGRNRVTLEGS